MQNGSPPQTLWGKGIRGRNHKNRGFDPGTFLAAIGEGRKSLTASRNQGIFTQGHAADAVFIYPKNIRTKRIWTSCLIAVKRGSRVSLSASRYVIESLGASPPLNP